MIMNNVPRNGSTPTRVEVGLLKEMVSQRFDDLGDLMKSEVNRLEGELESFSNLAKERWIADRRSVDKAEAAAMKALEVAKTESDDRLKAHNGLLETMKEQAATFALRKDVENLEDAVKERTAIGEGVRLSVGAIYGLVIALTAIIGTIVVVADVLTK